MPRPRRRPSRPPRRGASFAADTERAVKAFQGRKGIARDGKVGLNTW
ncbi:peptidoglycan-binding domain-containing protein [Streptomyces sp. NPDC002776]